MLRKIVRFLRITCYTTAMYFVTHLVVFFYLFPVGTVSIIINHENGYRVKRSITGLLFKIIGKRLKLLGLENIEPGKNYLVISNYPGSYAGFALMNIFPEASILVNFFLSRVPVVGFLLKSNGAVFVKQKRFGRTRRAIDEILKRNTGKNIIVLPEGGRSPDGSIHTFKHGFIYILRRSSMDLLPVTLNGFYSLKPLNRLYLDPDVELEVIIQEPIHHSTIKALNDEQLLNVALSAIRGSYKP